jgi:intracellular sulfur oxidation DsrE/DsrF family protein
MNKNNIDKKSAIDIASITELAEQSASAPIVRAGCKLCLSKYRSEIEDMYDQSKNISQCHRVLKSKGEDISYKAVLNHLTVHYAAIDQQEKVKNFTVELVRWRTDNIDKESRLNTVMAVLERRMIDIAAYVDGRGTEDTLKPTETLCKIASQIMACQNELESARMHKEGMAHFVEQVKSVIKNHVETSKNNEVKRGFIDLVSSLEKQIGGILPNGQTI